MPGPKNDLFRQPRAVLSGRAKGRRFDSGKRDQRSKIRENLINPIFQFDEIGADFQIGNERRFVRVIDARKPFDHALPGFLVEPFHVAAFANIQGGIDVDFDKVAGANDGTGHIPHRSFWADKGVDTDDSGIEKKPGYFGNPANVFHALGFREPQVVVDPGADIVSVEHFGEEPRFEKFSFELDRQGAFSGARKAGQPEDFAALPEALLVIVAGEQAVKNGVDMICQRLFLPQRKIKFGNPGNPTFAKPPG
jgi:hypothetical protein